MRVGDVLEGRSASNPLMLPDRMCAVADDLKEPRAKPLRVATLRKLAVCRDERILADVLGVSAIAGERERDRECRAEVSPREDLEGGRVAVDRASDQPGLGLRRRVMS